MASTTYRIKVAGDVRMTFAADFAQASSPIALEGDSTPFQVADASHRVGRAAEMLIAWCDSQGGSNVGDDEDYEIVAVVAKYTVTDGNNSETVDTLDDAYDLVGEWYDYMSDDERYEDTDIPAFTSSAKTVADLNRDIARWENEIAEACGHAAFAGHGNYHVSAASEMGLSLRVEETEAEEEVA